MAVEDYLARLARLLDVEPRRKQRILDEVRDHLEAAVEEQRGAGVSATEAVRRAVADFGSPEVVAAAFLGEREGPPEGGVVDMFAARREGSRMFEVELAGIEFRPLDREAVEKAMEGWKAKERRLPDELQELRGRLTTWPADTGPALLLQEPDGGRRLCVFVGAWEATSIAYALHGLETPRPLTHDFVGNLLGALQDVVTPERVVITRLENETFYAQLELASEGKTIPVDCRPSDGVAVAVRLGLPIFVAQELEPNFEAA